MNNLIMSKTLNIFKKLIYAHLLFLLIMSSFRIVFFNYYSPLDSISSYYVDIINAFILGFRLDLTVIGYIQAIPTIFLILFYYLKNEKILSFANRFFVYYLFITYTIVSFFLSADFGFYSYFKDHINILFFGFFDDDTNALLVTFWQNYNVVLILTIFFIYLISLFYLISRIFKIEEKEINIFNFIRFSAILFVLIFLVNFLAVRGTLGMYPLGKMIPNVSEHEFINKVSQNGFRAFTSAYGIRKKYLKRKYDIIKETGYKGRIEEAFEVFKKTKNIDRENFLNNITYKTKKIDDKDYNVVVIMVESFGLPITKYQSEKFDILSSLKKHFDEDILFTNFISSGDGTIASLEALMLNIPHRPNAFAISQSMQKQTPFTFSPAFLYKEEGYETSFIYGGDLSWRNIGKFIKFQSYDNVEGKVNIFNSLGLESENKEDFFHPWGIYDEYLYEYLFKKLENQDDKKQLIFALSTNNHPPYNVPNNYKGKSLEYTDEIKNHITGNFDLAKQRLKSYQYAVDQVGVFLDKFKKSKYKDNTIVVVTADNNTIDGIMEYDNNKLLNSKNIPLYFYMPENLRNKLSIDTTVEGSHKDIFPTLYNLTFKNKNYVSIGYNLFDKKLDKYGFNESMVVINDKKAKKLKKLNNKSNEKELNYYKAGLVVTQQLLNNTIRNIEK